MKPVTLFALTLLVFFVFAATGKAQVYVLRPPDVTVSVGYSNLQTQRETNLFYNHSGPYLDTNFAWPLPLAIPLQAGFGITGSGYADRESIPGYSNNDFYYDDDHLYSDVELFELEPRIGLRLGGETGFFALPRAGCGLLVSSYEIDQSSIVGRTTYISTRDHTGAAFELRPAILAGYSWGPACIGFEASYLYAWGNFGGLGRHAQELRAGGFLTFRF